jgi:filamentous hemagglutinin
VSHIDTGVVTEAASGAHAPSVDPINNQTPGVITRVPAVSTQSGANPSTIISTVTPNTTLPNSSLFHTNTNSSARYIIETDPRFANYRTWLSSDYMLTALSLDPALQTKRLGDGFYEQRLIREQVSQLTGKRFINGYSNDEAQYQALMANGVTFAQAYQLTPGVALSATQIAQLTSDIVWLVEKTITLPDGSTTQALVPQLYVRLQATDINNEGALLAGNNIQLKVTGDINNSGSIAGREIVNLTADNINNIGGRMQAGNQLALDAKHDINIIGTTSDISMQQSTRLSTSTAQLTQVNRLAGLYVTNPNGILVASAGNDINLKAADVQNSGLNGLTLIDAGHDLNIGTITQTTDTYGQGASGGRKGWRSEHITQEVGTSIQTNGDLMLNADHNLTARAATVTSEQGAITARAGNDISIEAGTTTYDMEAYRKSKSSGFLSSKSSVHHDTINSTDVIGSAFSGEAVNISAGNNLAVKGSSIVATQDVNLQAVNDITLTTAQATHDETHSVKSKKTGFSPSGGASIGYGSSKLATTNDSQQVTNVGSTVGSINGNVNINAGKTYTQTGSDILTPQGDINIAAQQVNIAAATDTYANQQTMKYQQTGLTLAITSPVISAIQTVQQMSKAASNTKDPRMQALAAGTAALAANNAKDAIIAGNTPQLDNNGLEVLDANGKNTAENPANQVGGINISLSIGTSKSSSKTTQTSTTAVSSTLNAGGNINITATGAGKDSDINVIGSQIKAAHDVTLKAEDTINLQAAQNVDTLKSTNKGSSASLGISFGTDGLLFTAGASGSKGKTKGNGSTWTETVIQGGNKAGDKVTLQSGTDTNVIGSQVIGNQIIANVGTNPRTGAAGTGNLNIQSLQDTNHYKDKQQSIGGSISIGYGKMGGSFNYSDSKTNSNYASVNEQAGFFAGAEGYQVNVAGNTNLTGAVMASTDKAIQDHKNSLITQTLTISNIENSAEYSAKGISFGTLIVNYFSVLALTTHANMH